MVIFHSFFVCLKGKSQFTQFDYQRVPLQSLQVLSHHRPVDEKMTANQDPYLTGSVQGRKKTKKNIKKVLRPSRKLDYNPHENYRYITYKS